MGSLNTWWLRRFGYVLAGALIFACYLTLVFASATPVSGSAPAWAQPSVMAIKRFSQTPPAQTTPVLLNNMDCSLVEYRLAASNAMQSSCFTPTAWGIMDSDSGHMIFNGTDEAVPMLSASPHQILVPWPEARDMIALDPVSTGGARISLYKNPLLSARDERNLLFQITAKQLTAAPELNLVDPVGQPLIINPQSLSFSDGGSWLMAETMNRSFVRINLATLDLKAFAPSYGTNGSPALLSSQVAISANGHYAAIYNKAVDEFKVYDLTTCPGRSVSLIPDQCLSFDYRPFVASQIKGLRSITRVRFLNDGLISFVTSSSDPEQDGIYELAPTAGITSLIDYLGMGDSFTSGEGAFDYISGTDSASNSCHLSIHSYPLLLTEDIFNIHSGHSVACSGATMHDITNTNSTYKGQVKDVADFGTLESPQTNLLNSVMTNFAPGYVAQQRFVNQYQPAVMTVSIGGNDVGFGDILETCVTAHLSRHHSDNDCFNSYEDRTEIKNLVDRTQPRWTALYKQLQAANPGKKLYAIGYPDIANDQGSCGLNVNLSRSELELARELTDYINQTISKAAVKAGVMYVDISQALVGHRLCEANTASIAVNGVTAGNDAGPLGTKVFGKESYHPNALGQYLIEQTILQKTHNLTALPPIALPRTSDLVKGPKTGRAINSRVPLSLTDRTATRGQKLTLKVSGVVGGLKPKTTYQVRIDGPAGLPVGSGTTDDNGDLDTIITIPAGTEPGGHTIDVTGENQAGQSTDVTQPIYVTDNPVNTSPIMAPINSTPTSVNNTSTDSPASTTPSDSSSELIVPANRVSSSKNFDASNSIQPASRLYNQTSRPSPLISSGQKMPEASKHALAKLPAKARQTIPKLKFFPWLILPILFWLVFMITIILIQVLGRRRSRPAYAVNA